MISCNCCLSCWGGPVASNVVEGVLSLDRLVVSLLDVREPARGWAAGWMSLAAAGRDQGFARLSARARLAGQSLCALTNQACHHPRDMGFIAHPVLDLSTATCVIILLFNDSTSPVREQWTNGLCQSRTKRGQSTRYYRLVTPASWFRRRSAATVSLRVPDARTQYSIPGTLPWCILVDFINKLAGGGIAAIIK